MKLTDESIKGMRALTKGIQDKALRDISEGRTEMKIEDCKTLPEFFGVEAGGTVWVEGIPFEVHDSHIGGPLKTFRDDGRALIGCLTGQLEWSKYEPMTAEEEKILREIAAWFPSWQTLRLEKYGDIGIFTDNEYCNYYFGFEEDSSKAYEVLAPILEKYGEINLDDYRGDEDEESPFGSCDFCGYAFNSELINEYEISHCPKCGEEIEESVDLGW